MKARYRLLCRNYRGGIFYLVDTLTGKRESLETQSLYEAEQLVTAKNQALRQPAINLQIARAYLAASDPGVAHRTWSAVIVAMSDKSRARQKRDGSVPARTRHLGRCLT
jgi:hypothetical protein